MPPPKPLPSFFGKHHTIDPAQIILLMQSNKNRRMAGADELRVGAVMEDIETRIHTVKAVLKKPGEMASKAV